MKPTRPLSTLAALLLTGLASLALPVSQASAQIVGIGIQFVGNGTALGPTESAGIISVEQQNWNPLTGASFSSVVLNDSTGTATTATLSGGANGGYFASSISAPPSGNTHLTSGELFNGWPGSPTLTISNIPYATYDVYLYASIDATGRAETTGLTPSGGAEQFYSFTTEGGGSTWTQAASTWDGTGTQPSLPSANYVLFTGLTASSFTLDWGAPGNGGLNAIQIVETSAPLTAPEPSTYALLLGGLALTIVLKRKTRNA